MKQVAESAGAEARQVARAELETLRPMIAGGSDFVRAGTSTLPTMLALVRRVARCRGSSSPAAEGSFEPAVAALEVGELSEVVATMVGLHLIQLVDRKPERVRTLEEGRVARSEIFWRPTRPGKRSSAEWKG